MSNLTRGIRIALTIGVVAAVLAVPALLDGSQVLAKAERGAEAEASPIHRSRAISIPFGISSAQLAGTAILVSGHDGTPPPVIESDAVRRLEHRAGLHTTKLHTTEPGCPPAGATVDIRVHVTNLSDPAGMAKGANTMSCSETTWDVTADIHTPGDFTAGDDVRVCAHALVRTDGPGKKGRVVGFRQWCKALVLE